MPIVRVSLGAEEGTLATVAVGGCHSEQDVGIRRECWGQTDVECLVVTDGLVG